MKPWLRYVIAVLILGILAAFIVYRYVYNKPHPDYEQAKAELSISAQALYQAYKQNTAGANGLYNGKVLEINGNLSRVEEVDSLVVLVFALEEGLFGDEGIRVSLLPDYHEKARELAPGTEIKVKGFCTGFTDADVIIEKGSIVK